MAKKKAELVGEGEAVLDIVNLAGLKEEKAVIKTAAEEIGQKVPGPGDPGWNDYVMSKFTPEETESRDGKRLPKAAGLRRVAAELIGPILESKPTFVESAAYEVRGGRLCTVKPAVVGYEMTFQAELEDGEGKVPYRLTVGDVGEVNDQNISQDFLVYATPTACTRAEVRCLRKALRLTVCAAEEISSVPIQLNETGNATAGDLAFVDNMSRMVDIDAWAFINSGKRKYSSPEAVPGDVIDKVKKCLSEFRGGKAVPADLKGYKEGWLS